MTIPTVVLYAIGYAFSLLGGRWGVPRVTETIRIQGVPRTDPSTAILGYVETAIYTTAWLVDERLFIPVWLGLKVGGYLGDVRGRAAQVETRMPAPQALTLEEARRIFNRWLIGTGLSLAYGVAGGVFIKSAIPGVEEALLNLRVGFGLWSFVVAVATASLAPIVVVLATEFLRRESNRLHASG